MDELKEILLILRELQPGALFVIALVAVGFAASKVIPAIYKVRQAEVGLETAKEEHDSQQENAWLSILEKMTAIQDRHLKLLDDIEKRTQERHSEGMSIMLGVKADRDKRIDAMQQTIQTVPALVIEAQQPHLSALDTSIQAAMSTLETNVLARLDAVEKHIPDAVKTTVAEVIREELSKLVKGRENDGTEQPSVGTVDQLGHSVAVDSTRIGGGVLTVGTNTGSERLEEAPAVDTILGGPAERSGNSDPVTVSPAA